MKTLPAGLQSHLDSGATTLCWCWLVTRADWEVYGFTDHDRPLSLLGTTFEPATGFTASDIRQSLGLNIDDCDASAALSSSTITDADLAAGLWDDARVEIWRVNWADTSQRVQVFAGSIGEVRRGETAFTAELRSLAHYLNQERGRTYQFACDAALGDSRCGLDVSGATFTGNGTVTAAATAYSFAASGLGAYASEWFSGGLLTWTSGANAGRSMEVKAHWIASGVVTVELWRAMPDAIAASDTFTIVAGCDKTFATCRDKFANGVNFRGFPYIPGRDYMLKIEGDADYSTATGRSMFNE